MFRSKICRWAAVAIAMIAAVAGTGCKKHQTDPFPASGAVAGWDKSSDTRTFAAKDLWQYVDGDAEQYVSAGVVSTSTSDYKYRSEERRVGKECRSRWSPYH